ncbi:hypothetical protein LCGC14_1769730 [marine sediment metagenome]|uniref:Uncharacterized protein n=1 Tax=marine sediment metagenome TaxID=412755 RepID=A0A0F9GYP4_9ZZZZ
MGEEAEYLIDKLIDGPFFIEAGLDVHLARRRIAARNEERKRLAKKGKLLAEELLNGIDTAQHGNDPVSSGPNEVGYGAKK